MNLYKGKIPFDELPHVALMTMAFNPVYTKHSVIDAHHQIYPSDKLTHVLLHQAPYPPQVDHDITHKIVEINVSGEWSAVWMFKLLAFIDYCKKGGIEYMAFWDEDDMFPPFYLWGAVDSLLANGVAGAADITWTSYNKCVKRESIKDAHYANPVGNAVGRVVAFRKAASKLAMYYPKGVNRRNPECALDDKYWNMLSKHTVIHDRTDTKPLRAYMIHRLANTLSNRPPEENIDYNWTWEKT